MLKKGRLSDNSKSVFRQRIEKEPMPYVRHNNIWLPIINALRIISNFGLGNTLNSIVTPILESIKGLYNYLTTNYGEAESIERELPFYHARTLYILHGEMDMVWHYRKGK